MLEIGPPKGLFPYVIDFAKSISPDSELLKVSVVTGPEDMIKECTKNVEKYIKEHGGEQVLGWKIWEWYGVMIEAEFHSVWRMQNGELRDVTPHEEPIAQVLFLPDLSLKYDEKQIDNIRKALNDDPLVKEYIKDHESLFEFMNRGERATQHGAIEFSDAEVAEWQKLQVRIAQLGMQIVSSNPGRNHFCRCGSGKKSKKCCSK